ncbi:adenylate kinase family protein [Haloferula chungangensis]|uniref:Adenylate kinase n=1 Tax=Haloferula chungangensis TaxID=1048331 RepID=A0ABW2L7Z6_9BACT
MGPNLILLGPPASGKGTQGRRLANSLNLPYLSTGAMLREAVENGTPAGKEAEPILERGGYVSDELMGSIMEPWFKKHRKGWVLDGFPRTIAQDDDLRRWLAEAGTQVDAAISLEAPKDVLVARIESRVECPDCRWSGQTGDLGKGDRCPKCGGRAGARSDDTLENFLSRFDEFALHTLPVIERYASVGGLIRCDATAPMDTVTHALLKSVQAIIEDGQKA